MNLSASEVAERAGVSYRKLQHWRATGLVVPSARTRGGQHRYTEPDLRRLRLLRVLTASGISVRRSRRVLAQLHREVEGMLEVAKAEAATAALQVLGRT